ncbi:GGDEF domain-containing protein [Neptunomonas antarctica]|uniref:diguanylate cyclase n=1 Tax=Neptunomonas antarctica TaxID=619304 RepID=A0A1N7PAS1_9GAMM|nr:GGDEF domain-containing protein [Neptunomonas antarctica]SIT07694.1 diguanylate cyclase (GGDEF) domain-containing protein [Neptunomonas antarctica]
MNEYSKQLQKQGLIDLTIRGKAGIAAYPVIWLLITLPYLPHTQFPAFFYINTAILACILLSRIWHLSVFNRDPEASASKMYRWLVGSILLAGIHWGVMFAIIVYHWDDSSMPYVWTMATMAFAIGASVVLSISNVIRAFYPLAMVVPGVCIFIIYGGSDQWVFAATALITLAYIHVTTKVTHADYWGGLKNRFLAEERAEKMERLSHTDQLTQLNNRMFFDRRFCEEWKRSSRSKSPLSILMLDLDYFKVVNDSYGHVFGDECLKRVAETLQATVHRETDSVARYGGEEFVVLLPYTNQQDSEAIATRLLSAIHEIDMSVGSQKVSLTCSIGIATGYAKPGQNREMLLKSADDALYQAKDKGRNRVQVGTSINAS